MPAPRRSSSASSTETRVGEVIKRLRKRTGLSLRALGARTGFSASFLSQLEKAQVSPSIGSLERIARELGVTLGDLFDSSYAAPAGVVRADGRAAFTSGWSRARVESLVPAATRSDLEALVITLAPAGSSGEHPGMVRATQLAYVLDGKITLIAGDARSELSAGDAVTIPRRSPHRWENESAAPARVLLVSRRAGR
jgi:transcriptional regulator with XRE-family HTH domain